MSNNLIDFIVVEENEEHFLSFKRAFDQYKFEGRPLHVRTVPELLELLTHPDRAELPNFKPRLILIVTSDLSEDLRQFLEVRKDRAGMRKIPLVILTLPSSGPEEKQAFYEYGANSVLLKPDDPRDYPKLIETLGQYWFDLVMLPSVE